MARNPGDRTSVDDDLTGIGTGKWRDLVGRPSRGNAAERDDGLEERDALKASAKDYNLIISNAIQGGNFTEGETIIISGNNKTLTINDAGPLVYARLPSGTYLIKGINGKETTERTLAITDHEQARIHFIWSH